MGGSNRPSFVAEKANQYEQSGVETSTSDKIGFNLSVCGIALSMGVTPVRTRPPQGPIHGEDHARSLVSALLSYLHPHSQQT